MDEKEMFEMFGEFDPTAYEEEVCKKWGKTEAYAESARRTAKYTKADWATIRAEADAITQAFAAHMAEALAPGDPKAMDVAERHRLHIDRSFYPCPHAQHVHLGEMYVADERFAANYEKVRPGLAAFVRDAIAANARAR